MRSLGHRQSEDRWIRVATTNRGKLREIASGLNDLPLRLRTIPDQSVYVPPEETGSSYRENAFLKARAACAHFGEPVLAEDSGLEVEALNGQPGVHSARFGGDHLGDRGRIELLLKELDSVPAEKRGARFVCVMVLLFGEDRILEARGEVRGTILNAPRGKGGFGYDPIFFHAGFQKTFAELTEEEKNAVSHRGLAARHLVPELRRLIALDF